MFNIEKNIPLPKEAKPKLTCALRKMDVGDSICGEIKQTACHQAAKNIGIKVTTESQSDGSLRVWRIA